MPPTLLLVSDGGPLADRLLAVLAETYALEVLPLAELHHALHGPLLVPYPSASGGRWPGGRPVIAYGEGIADGGAGALVAGYDEVLDLGLMGPDELRRAVARALLRPTVPFEVAERTRAVLAAVDGVAFWTDPSGPSGRAWPPALRTLTGLPPGQVPPTAAVFLSRVHSEDRQAVDAHLRSARLGPREVSFRWLRYDGRVAHVKSTRLPPEPGQPLALVLQDETVEAELREQLLAERDRARAVMGAVSEGCLFQQLGIILDANRALVEMTGWSRDELLGRCPPPFLAEADVERLTTAATWGVTDVRLEIVVTRKDGTGFPAVLHCRTTLDGEPLSGCITTIRDVTAEKERWDGLVATASTDALTGLLNRRAFEEALARGAVEDPGLALVLFDLDHFKHVNDTFGHPVGDGVLEEVGRRASALARSGDVVARIGGEELAWLIPSRDAHVALALAERLRVAVGQAPFVRAGTVTLSAGVARGRPGEDARSLYGRADALLYAAKRAGRDRVAGEGEGEGGIDVPEQRGSKTPAGSRATALLGVPARGSVATFTAERG